MRRTRSKAHARSPRSCQDQDEAEDDLNGAESEPSEGPAPSRPSLDLERSEQPQGARRITAAAPQQVDQRVGGDQVLELRSRSSTKSAAMTLRLPAASPIREPRSHRTVTRPPERQEAAEAASTRR